MIKKNEKKTESDRELHVDQSIRGLLLKIEASALDVIKSMTTLNSSLLGFLGHKDIKYSEYITWIGTLKGSNTKEDFAAILFVSNEISKIMSKGLLDDY